MIQNTLYKAILKSVSGRYAIYGANALSTVVLARLFTPSEFGVVASIMVFYVFFQMMAEGGLGPAIINIHDFEEENRDGIFTLTLLLGIFLAFLFYLSGPILQTFYNVNEIRVVVPFVALSIFFFSCSIVPNAFLLREQSFYRIGIAGVVSELLSLMITISLLKFVSPLEALSSKGLVAAIVNFILLYYFSSKTTFKRPVLGKKLNAIVPLLSFTMYQFGYNFINFFLRNLDNVLVGKYLGPASLGIYEKAYKLMKYPLMLLTFAMTPAIQPVLRKHFNEVSFVEKVHRDFTLKLSILGGIAGLVSFFFAGEIIRILLGPQWDGVIPVFKIFSISIPIQVVLSTSGSFFQALNKPKLLFHAAMYSSIFLISALIYGIQKENMIDVAWALVAAFHVNFLIVYFILYRFVFKCNTLLFFAPMIAIFAGLLILFINFF